MSEEVEKLKEISGFFRRMSGKIKLIELITKAKREYDNYEYTSAEETLNEILKSEPENSTALRGLGCIKQFWGEYEAALDYYKRALKNSNSREIEYTLAGTVCYLQNKLDDALEYFNLAIEANDNYDPAYEGRNQAMLEDKVRILDLQETLKKYF